MIPSVPSEPTKRLVKLYPAEVFFALVPVFIISPFAKTTVRPRTVVLIVPYLTAVRYGTMRTTVLGLTVVLANGDIIKTGTRAKKTSAGYNLTNLFVGSEGTLGIITEVHLRLSPVPESIMSAICQFPDLDSAESRSGN